MRVLTRVRVATGAPDEAEAAETVLRLAVLLQAGVAPARAWEHLAAAGDAAAIRVRAEVARGAPLSDAISTAGCAVSDGAGADAGATKTRRARPRDVGRAREVWRDVAAAWHVAATVGAPLADSLRGLAAALRDAQEARDEIRVALAEPAGTAKLMAWLPLVAVALGLALGFDTIGVLVMNPVGIACLVAGAALMLAARRWTGILVGRAEAAGAIPGLDAELLAIALSGGVSIERAYAVVAEAASVRPEASTEAVLDLSHTAGVPAVELLRASAALARHRARIDGRLRAARLSSRLLLPLGVCTLPAFLLLGVAPMLLSVLSAVPLDGALVPPAVPLP